MSGGTPATGAYDPGCTRCPRLAAFLRETRSHYPDYWARPVPSFGDAEARMLIVGLAPGMHGANRTGRPFTGDHAGILLYQTSVRGRPCERGHLASAATVCALRARASPMRSSACRRRTSRCRRRSAAATPTWPQELRELTGVRVYLALGRVAHDAVLLARG